MSVFLLLIVKFRQRLIKYKPVKTIMKISHRNLAMILIGVVVMSTSGVYSLTQSAQTQTSSGTTEQPLILGHIEAIVKDPNGNIKAYRQTDNLVVTNGLNATVNQLFANSLQPTTNAAVSKFNWVGVGTSSTAAAYQQIDLQAVRGSHHSGTVTQIALGSGGTGSGMGAQIVANWGAGILANSSSTSTTINEAALFDGNANATSNIYARQVISPGISMGTADTLQVTWKITFAHS
jgi:hypothetical protein